MKKSLKLVFSKKVLGALILLAQLAVFIATVDTLYTSRTFILGGTTLLAAVFVLFEINRDVSPSFKLIWIALIALFPVLGILLYLYVHFDFFSRKMKKRLEASAQTARQYTEKITYGFSRLVRSEPDEADIFNYLHRCANAPCYCESDAQYFETGEKMYESLIRDVQSAEKYIFIEFFIINESSYMWNRLYSILKEKVKNGVDVRIIYDAMGSLTTLKPNFDERLRSAGIKCSVFSPVRPFLSTYHNNRDHRKIVVADGKCAYTGGVNIADEYINRKCRFGHWKDSAVRITGEAVKGFTGMFIDMWKLLNASEEDCGDYISASAPSDSGEGFMAPFDDNPLDNESVSENVYLHIINNAKKYAYISTPYLILDDELSNALRFAAKRGVDVRIIMPHIPDKWYAFALARTYYPELIHSGVKIYEYTPGFIHAKSTVSDDKRAFIGSANYDFRSLYLHYECGVYIYKNRVIGDMRSDFLFTLERCSEFTLEDYKSLNIFYRLIGRIFRFFAPLM